MKSVYEQMAVTTMTKSYCRQEGQFPKVSHIAVFEHANGLITEFNGDKWKVVAEGK